MHWYGNKKWNAPTIVTDKTIKNDFRAGEQSERLRKSVLSVLNEKYKEHQIRYTDGSKTSSGVGYGVHAQGTGDTAINISKKLSNICSSFSAEAAGILEGARIPAVQPLVILTDSASAIDAIQGGKSRHPWVQAIQRFIKPNTVLMWVPGHCGIRGNEAADQLAGSGHTRGYLTRKVPFDDIKQWIKRTFRHYWETRWYQSRDLFLRKVKATPNRFKDHTSQKEQTILSRLRTGHCRLSHNFSNGSFHITCDACDLWNTVEHFLCACPKYEQLRQRHKISGSIREVLGDDEERSATLISFLKDARLFHSV